MKKRYGNIKQDYMKKIYKSKDELGLTVIYVEECDKYEKENQKEVIYRKDYVK